MCYPLLSLLDNREHYSYEFFRDGGSHVVIYRKTFQTGRGERLPNLLLTTSQEAVIRKEILERVTINS